MPDLQDSTVPAVDYPIRLPVFEGPLDLLLFLIRKHEIEIYDIPIDTVTDQYLAVLYGMEKLNLEIAGEFFVMAATLMHIKSRMLLPQDEQPPEEEKGDEEVDPRWELVQQLIEYKKFKEAAAGVERLIRDAQDLLPRQVAESTADLAPHPLKPVDRIDVWNTFNQVLRRLAEKMTVGELHGETVTIAGRMEFLIDCLRHKPRFTFSEIFEGEKYSLATLVATFLAVLELTRIERIKVRQDDLFEEVYLEAIPEEERTEREG